MKLNITYKDNKLVVTDENNKDLDMRDLQLRLTIYGGGDILLSKITSYIDGIPIREQIGPGKVIEAKIELKVEG